MLPAGTFSPAETLISHIYRSTFNAQVKEARKIRFRNNFKIFYLLVLDDVATQPEVKAEIWCQLCEEGFIRRDDHFEAVFQPYVEYVLEGAEPGHLRHLDQLFGKNIMPQLEYSAGVWTDNIWSSDSPELCRWMNYFQKFKAGDISLGRLVYDLVPETDLKSWIMGIPSQQYKTVDDIAANVLAHFSKKSPTLEKIYSYYIVIPSFLKAYKNFTEWTNLALKFNSLNEPNWALLFAKAGSIIGNKEENCLMKLGDNFLKTDISSAHQCYMLGRYDLNAIAKRLVTDDHVNSKKLAAHYLIESKDFDNLTKFGIEASEKNDNQTSTILLMPLFCAHWNAERFNDAIRILRIFVPKENLWKCLQSAVMDKPGILLQSGELAYQVVLNVEESLELATSGAELTSKGNLAVKASAVLGALHILSNCGNMDLYSKTTDISRKLIKPLLEVSLSSQLLSLMVATTRIPSSQIFMKEILKKKGFTKKSRKNVRTEDREKTGLHILRGILEYKRGNIFEMVNDFETASITKNGDELVTSAIASFITRNPLIHEKILNITSLHFSKIRNLVWNYPDERLDHSKYPTFISNVDDVDPWEKGDFTRLISVFQERAGGNQQILAKLTEILSKNPQINPTKRAELFATKGYEKIGMSAIFEGAGEIPCFTLAAAFFLQAMKATPISNLAEKFAYRQLILKCLKQLKNFANMRNINSALATYSQRARLQFRFLADLHFSECLDNESNKDSDEPDILLDWLTKTDFLDDDKVDKITAQWQSLINSRILCPISTLDVHSVLNGAMVLEADSSLNNAFLLEKVNKRKFSANISSCLYYQLLFTRVLWRQDCTKYLEEFQPIVEPLDHGEMNIGKKQRKREKQEFEKKKLEWENEFERMPITERKVFQSTRIDSMLALAKLHGHEISDVERTMGWHLIRRNPDGFIDINDRTLNFEGEEAFSKFAGLRFNFEKKICELLLEPSVTGDPERPPLFTLSDVAEILGNNIGMAFISFNPPSMEQLEDCRRIELQDYPFWQVFMDGSSSPFEISKESICGTNFHMTLYHLDLLLKMLTTGQEVSAKFPFGFKTTEAHLLSNLSSGIQRALAPMGQRVPIAEQEGMHIMRVFGLKVSDVEVEYEIQSSESLTLHYGNVSVSLSMTPLTPQGIPGHVRPFQTNSPEGRFSRDFIKNLPSIEKAFPIIARIKELAKITHAMKMYGEKKEPFPYGKAPFPNENAVEVDLPFRRPYSNCGKERGPCKCCDLVPVVYREMKPVGDRKPNRLDGNVKFYKVYGSVLFRPNSKVVSSVNRIKNAVPVPISRLKTALTVDTEVPTLAVTSKGGRKSLEKCKASMKWLYWIRSKSDECQKVIGSGVSSSPPENGKLDCLEQLLTKFESENEGVFREEPALF